MPGFPVNVPGALSHHLAVGSNTSATVPAKLPAMFRIGPKLRPMSLLSIISSATRIAVAFGAESEKKTKRAKRKRIERKESERENDKRAKQERIESEKRAKRDKIERRERKENGLDKC